MLKIELETISPGDREEESLIGIDSLSGGTMRLLLWLSLLGCTHKAETDDATPADPCEGAAALADCLHPTLAPEYYVEQAHLYFNTMDTAEDRSLHPEYSELVARWEWPPWLLLTAFGYDNIMSTDTLLRAYPSTIPERDCRFFEAQPFARCRVVFFYDDPDHEGRGCPIYEEFAFNDAGEMTFIEAWSDLPGQLPMAEDDTWAEGEDVTRLSTRIPGLGTADARLELGSAEMEAAAATDPDVADFVYRANNWLDTWSEAYAASGDDLWERGCGW
jgi:hypothetical protein